MVRRDDDADNRAHPGSGHAEQALRFRAVECVRGATTNSERCNGDLSRGHAGKPRVIDSAPQVEPPGERFRAVTEVNRALLDGWAGEEILELIARRSRELVGASIALVLTPEDDSVLRVRIAAGDEAPAFHGMRFSIAHSYAGEVLRSGNFLVVPDLGQTWGNISSPLAERGLHSAICVPLVQNGRPIGVMQLANRKEARTFTEDDVYVVGLFAAQAGLAAEHIRAQEDLQRLVDTTIADKPLQEVLDALTESVVEAIGAVACTVHVFGPDLALRTAGNAGLDEELVRGLDGLCRTGCHCPPHTVIVTRSPVVVDNAVEAILREPHYEPVHPLVRAARWEAVACLPLLWRGNALGALCCFYPKGERPSRTQMALLQVIAGQAASAVENIHLSAALQDRIALEERQRLARELHDSVSQALYGIVLGAQTARHLIGRNPDRLISLIEYILQLADAGLVDTRALIAELLPEALEKDGLVVMLTRQVEALRTRRGITGEAFLGSEPDVTADVKQALYRIAQEALHNASKHSGARRVVVRQKTTETTLTLEVVDDGVGFEATANFPGHVGLRSMRDRASSVGGQLDVRSSPGKGTHLRVTVPLKNGPRPDRKDD